MIRKSAEFDPLFAEAVAARLASEIAVTLSESVNKAQALWQVYTAKAGEARRRNAQEGQPHALPDGSWLGAGVSPCSAG